MSMINFLRSIFLLCFVLGSAQARTIATFHTPAGDMDVELYDDQKPVTVQNFIKLVQGGAYNNTFFHRCMNNFIVQGGGYATASQTDYSPFAFAKTYYVPNQGAITNEFLVGQRFSNTYGTIAMAKVSTDPNSATSQWFFNLGNNSALDAQNGGFTVFGKVISGTNVLEQFRTSQKGGGIVDLTKLVNYGASYAAFSDLPVIYNGFTPPKYADLMYADIKLSNYSPYYTLKRSTNGNGTVSISTDQPAYPSGTALQLFATPSDGYAFTSWSGSYAGSQNPLTVVMSSNLNITAQFDKTWSMTVTSSFGGYVTKVPDQTSYLNQSTVTLLPTPYPGFRFAGWSGATNGTMNPLAVVMNTNKTIGATFLDIAPPQVTIQSPVAGNSVNERIVLSGVVTDNVKLSSVHWELDGLNKGQITVDANDSTFQVGAIVLHRGANVIRVAASDTAGNIGTSDVIVSWTPSRTIFVGTVADQQEGSRVSVPLQLTSQGDVGGINMMMTYDTNYLTDAQFSWGSIAANSQKQVQPAVAGRVQANFQQPSAAIPAGTMTFASVSFRLRSVPNVVSTPVTLAVSRVSLASGEQITFGTDVQSGTVGILKRTLTGDGDANNKLDIGDAVLIQKLLAGITPQRAWDVTGNDLNKNGRLDSDDVTRVLRVVVGLDSQPAGAMGLLASEGSSTAQSLEAADASNAISVALSDQAVPASHAGLVSEGRNITVQVLFTNLQTQITGAALAISYPTEAFRLIDYQTASPFVPSGAASLWNPVLNDGGLPTGNLVLAAASPSAWLGTNGLVATIMLQAIAGSTAANPWPVSVSQVELTPDGYGLRALADASVSIRIGPSGPPRLSSIDAPAGGTTFGFLISGQVGQTWEVEASENMIDWTLLLQTNNATGSVKYSGSKIGSKRFYRVVAP